MGAGRVEAFSDGVIAIIVTVMVLELKAPANTSLDALLRTGPSLASYLLSFVVVAIMWVNHHHLLATVRRVDARLLWANNNLLFWMSLIPLATAYMGQNQVAPVPVAVYGAVMGLSASAFTILRFSISRHHADDPDLMAHHRRMHRKNLLGTTLYLSSAALAFVSVYIAFAIFVLIPLSYFVPERKLAEHVYK